MTAALAPTSFAELVEAVRATPRLLAIGAGTKPRLSAVDVPKLSTTMLRGITAYDPSEFTFTALAGTPIREIAATLAGCGQYLPFDPMLAKAGATLGGTVAAGLSGPGRFRFGGVRDFILGVRFMDGAGRLIRMGGKVVKNAAGFDLPKFFVGSLGRFGVLAEITFKVFPCPAAALTLRLSAPTLADAARVLMEAASSRFEFAALDVCSSRRKEAQTFATGGGESLLTSAATVEGVLARIAGPASALEPLGREILGRWPGEMLPESDAERAWTGLREFRWVDENADVVKVALSPASLVAMGRAAQSLAGAEMHVSAGGNVAFVALPDAGALDAPLRELGLPGMTLRGDAPLWLGVRARPAIAHAVKNALDPENRFPSIDD